MVGNFSCFLFGHENHSGGQFKRLAGKCKLIYKGKVLQKLFVLICSQKTIIFKSSLIMLTHVESSLIKFDQIHQVQSSLIKFDQVRSSLTTFDQV